MQINHIYSIPLICLLLATNVTVSNVALAQKDCSHTKTMDELKKCDPQQYADAMKVLGDAQATLQSTYQTQQEANQALQNHVDTLHSVNEDLKKLLEETKQWNSQNH